MDKDQPIPHTWDFHACVLCIDLHWMDSLCTEMLNEFFVGICELQNQHQEMHEIYGIYF